MLFSYGGEHRRRGGEEDDDLGMQTSEHEIKCRRITVSPPLPRGQRFLSHA